jgi:hypothetical protein
MAYKLMSGAMMVFDVDATLGGVAFSTLGPGFGGGEQLFGLT